MHVFEKNVEVMTIYEDLESSTYRLWNEVVRKKKLAVFDAEDI